MLKFAFLLVKFILISEETDKCYRINYKKPYQHFGRNPNPHFPRCPTHNTNPKQTK